MISLIVGLTFLLWLIFAALMALKRRAERDVWPRWALAVLRVLFAIGYIYDTIYNTTVGSLLFWEEPHLEPLTARLKRLYSVMGWRGSLARLFCDYLIHPIDKGHCL